MTFDSPPTLIQARRKLFALCLSFLVIASNAADGEDGFCAREAGYLDAKGEQGLPETPPIDASCFVDSLDNDANRLIVDTRRDHQYDRLHIRNSVHLLPNQLLAKTHLKSMPLLIVTEPFARATAGRLCSRLQASGFEDVQIMKGGVAALVDEGLSSNRPVEFLDITRIDPRQTLAELMYDQVHLVTVEGSIDRLPENLGRLVSQTVDLSDKQGTRRALLSVASDTRFPVVIAGTEKDYVKVREILTAATSMEFPSNIYLVDGGAESLIEYLRNHRQTRIAMNSVPSRYRCL